MWYLSLFLSIFAISGVNIIDKSLSSSIDRRLVLFYRYSASIIFLLGAAVIFQVSYITWVYAAICIGLWVLSYLNNTIMYRGLEQINTWVFFVIGYLYIVFLFFVNIYLFGGSEIIGGAKILFGIGFASVVFAIMYLWGVESHHSSRLWYVFALLCALGWTLSYAVSVYLVKTIDIHPIAMLLYEAIGACIFWAIMLYHNRSRFPNKVYTKQEAIAPILGWSLLSLGLMLFFISYWYLPANVVNIISLSDLLVTTLFGYYFLQESIKPRILILGCIAFILLIGFSLV